MARLYAVDVLCHHHATHHVEHLQFSVAADDDFVAILISENLGAIGKLGVLEYQQESVVVVGWRTDEGVRRDVACRVFTQVDFHVFNFVDKADPFKLSPSNVMV